MIRIGFYSLTALVALLGLYGGFRMAAPHLIDRIDGNWSIGAEDLETCFRGVVLFFLSLIVLILVHLAHRLGRVFDVPAKTASPERVAPDPPETL